MSCSSLQVLALLLLATITSTQNDDMCEGGWLLYKGSCYWVFNSGRHTRQQAGDICRSDNSKIADLYGSDGKEFAWKYKSVLTGLYWTSNQELQNKCSMYTFDSGERFTYTRTCDNFGKFVCKKDQIIKTTTASTTQVQTETTELEHTSTPDLTTESTVTQNPKDKVCLSGWAPFKGYCFFIDHQPTYTQQRAGEKCQALGADLALFSGRDSFVFFNDHIGHEVQRKYNNFYHGYQGAYWTSFIKRDGKYYREISDKTGDTCYYLDKKGRYESSPCDVTFWAGFICEKKQTIPRF